MASASQDASSATQGSKGGASRIDRTLRHVHRKFWFLGLSHSLTASRSKPNERTNSALVGRARFFLALIALAFSVLIGAFVFAAFTL
jgi:hypothetical protein